MIFSNVFNNFLIRNGITQTDFSKTVGISTGLCADWLKGRSQPSLTTMLKICTAYRISFDEFLQMENYVNKKNLEDKSFSKDENHLIELYRKLDIVGKQIIINLAKMESRHLSSHNQKNTEINVLNSPDISKQQAYLKVYNQPAAAGYGAYVDDTDFTLVPFPSIPDNTEFGIRISGNSMSPTINHGETVFVKRQSKIDIGEIGIFFINGDAYCKELKFSNGKYFLHSHNSDYKDITLDSDDDSVYCTGKVILT